MDDKVDNAMLELSKMIRLKIQFFKKIFFVFYFFMALVRISEGKSHAQLLLPNSPLMAGDFFEITLFVEAPVNSIVIPPENPALFQPFELISYESKSKKSKETEETEIKYKLFSDRSGEFSLGPFEIQIHRSEQKPEIIRASGVQIKVQSFLKTLAPEPNDIFQIKDFHSPAFEQSMTKWWSVVLPVAMIVISGIIFNRLRKKQKKEEISLESPAAMALRLLQELSREELGTSIVIERFYVRLSGILRKFLEGEFDIHAMELPTSEIKRAFNQSSLGMGWVYRLHQVLERMDLVKFACFKMSHSSAFEDLEVVRALIQESLDKKPVNQQSQEKAK